MACKSSNHSLTMGTFSHSQVSSGKDYVWDIELISFAHIVNFTYSIDLTTPWTNSTVQLHTISPKAAPVVNQEALWLDADNKTIYVYDGGVSQAPVLWYQSNDIPKNGLWQFTPSGNTGHWSSSYISPSSSFSSLSRVSSGLYAYGNGMGFAVGGRQTDATSYDIFPYITDSILTPGMVIYNISTQEWKNVSITDYSYSGFAVDGAAHFVPSFGPNGLLFVLGGNTGTVENPQPAQFDYVWMYEPGSDKWARQKVSGDVPTERQNQCVVGVQGDEGTYEVRVQSRWWKFWLIERHRYLCTVGRSIRMSKRL